MELYIQLLDVLPLAKKKIYENALEMVQTLHKLKPTSSKGTYIKSVTLSSTMSAGITIDTKSIKGI